MAEGDVRVQRIVLEPRRRLDRRDDLARHAQLGKAAERGLLVGPEVAHGLVQADHPFLDEVVAVAAREEVGARLEANEPRVPAHQVVERLLASVSRLHDELKILELSLDLLGWLQCGGGPSGHALPPCRRLSRNLQSG
jgi:hypothetical protein